MTQVFEFIAYLDVKKFNKNKSKWIIKDLPFRGCEENRNNMECYRVLGSKSSNIEVYAGINESRYE